MYFETMIWPTYLNGAGSKQCTKSACHDPSGQSALRFELAMPIDYQTNYKATQIYLNCGDAGRSELLTKPLAGIDPHGGGDIFPDQNDPAVQVVLDWFSVRERSLPIAIAGRRLVDGVRGGATSA